MCRYTSICIVKTNYSSHLNDLILVAVRLRRVFINPMQTPRQVLKRHLLDYGGNLGNPHRHHVTLWVQYQEGQTVGPEYRLPQREHSYFLVRLCIIYKRSTFSIIKMFKSFIEMSLLSYNFWAYCCGENKY